MRLHVGKIFRSNALLRWIQQTLQPKQFLIFSAILVGLTAGLAAVVLKLAVHFIATRLSGYSVNHYIVALCPLIGISLCSLYVFYLNRNRLGKGMVNILHAIAKKSSYLPKDQMYSHIVSSALTVGFGGSVGLESPIVTTGAAIGSNYSRAYKLSYKERTLLLACGSAAGIAGAFNTPIAGVLFALEVLLVEAGITAFVPLLVAGATGALCSKVILHEDVLLHFSLREPFNYSNTFYYFLLAIFCGIVSFYYSKVFLAAEKLFMRARSRITKSLLAGAGLFFLVLLLPPLFGEGYDSIKSLSEHNPRELFSAARISASWVEGKTFYLLLLLVILMKPVAVAFTLGGGGNGGNFAPSLFTGAFAGYLFAAGINALGITSLPVSNFTLVAMAGLLSGVFHAPLTGIFIIAEVTGGYELIIPLMIVAAISFAVARYFMPLSIDLLKLSQKEKIIITDTDSYLLSNIELKTFIENDFSEVPFEAKLGEMVQVIASSRRNIFAVTDKQSGLKGLITIDDIRDIMFRQEMYDTVTVKELMRKPGYVLTGTDDIRSAMKMFDESHLWNIPVVIDGKYRGFISKSTILEKYRETLIQSTVG